MVHTEHSGGAGGHKRKGVNSMSTRVTVLQALKLALTALIIGLVPNLLHAGDKAYIEIEIDGETVGKWMEFFAHWEYNPDGKKVYYKMAGFDETVDEIWYEYDRNGKLIHKKYSDGWEEWYEYDRNGNKIHEKYSNGDETWYEYDRNGNKIHEKDSDGWEVWYEYDRNGNCIHKKVSDGEDWWYEYDRNGKLIHEKSSDGYEWWAEYDRNGKRIYEKDFAGDETWHKYDRNGKRIHTKYSDGSKRWYEYDTYGNMTRKIWKSEDGKIDITVYILEYYRGSTTVKTKTAYRYEQ